MTNTGQSAFERYSIFENEFRLAGFTSIKKIMLEENWDANDMIQSATISEIASLGRSLIFIKN